MRRWAIGALAFLGLALCALPEGRNGEPDGVMQVENYSYERATVYVMRSATPWRVGVVEGGQRERFRVRPDLLDMGTLRVGVRLFASNRAWVSDGVASRDGVWTVRIEQALQHSSVVPWDD